MCMTDNHTNVVPIYATSSLTTLTTQSIMLEHATESIRLNSDPADPFRLAELWGVTTVTIIDLSYSSLQG